MTGQSLDSLVAGVEAVAAEARRQLAAAEEQAARWQQQYEEERELRAQLQQQQEREQQASQQQAAGTQTSASAPWAAAAPPPGAQQGSTPRRHTAPPQLTGAEMLTHLSSTAAKLDELKKELEEDMEAGRAPDGSIALSRLAHMLHACSFLREASAAAADGACDAEGDVCTPEDVANGTCNPCDAEGSTELVALHDDGAAGVGGHAAAAVSVALAQSWAAAAGSHQASARRAAVAQGAVRPGKARFKLVAAVPRAARKRELHQQLSLREKAAAARVQAAASETDSSPKSPGSSAGGMAHSPSAPSLKNLGAFNRPVHDSSATLVNLADAEPTTLDESQEASWRATGQHLKLQWLSPPSTVLVVHKPVPKVFDSCVAAVAWLVRRGLTVYVEPGVHSELAKAVQKELESGGGTDASLAATCAEHAAPESPAVHADSNGASPTGSLDSGDVWPPPGLPPRPGGGASHAAAHAQQQRESKPADLSRQLLTWEEGPCGCPPCIPCSVGHQLDLVITLGGDGTVLWTCGLFDSGAVPPIVPFAMGSLGFMTPFQIGHMHEVLARVTGVGHGLPLMLRHRLQARILRGAESAANGGSNPDLAAAACQQEFQVLNEVVIDRGPKANLCNLQCHADNSHVTVIQGDGLIVATPTGSTAYNLAAGGSMVHPGVPCLLFTPICAHSLSSRPLVLPEHVILRIKVPPDARSSAFCSFDGRSRQELFPGDSVLVSMSRWPAPMVCHLDASHDWFLSMREGLCWNVRKQQAGRGQ